jgi:hypothetical protein
MTRLPGNEKRGGPGRGRWSARGAEYAADEFRQVAQCPAQKTSAGAMVAGNGIHNRVKNVIGRYPQPSGA